MKPPRDNWDDSYPPLNDRPHPDAWPPWYQLEPRDLAECLGRSRLPFHDIRTMVDLGSGDGYRIIYALARTPPLNRPDLHLTCIDFSARAIMWGIDLWNRIRARRPVGDLLPAGAAPAWSISYRNEDALALPPDLDTLSCDLLIDWMMFHGLPRDAIPTYVAQLKRRRPKYFILKCFSTEGSTQSQLRRAVRDVDKRRWSEHELQDLLGDTYEPHSPFHQCPEELERDDGDGPRAAKREYCFRLRKA